MKPYRPSNGADGDWFMSLFCNRCVKDTAAHPCSILSRSMTFYETDKRYPRELVEDDENGPQCTAFADHRNPPLSIIRDPRQEILI